jgi:sacsin
LDELGVKAALRNDSMQPGQEVPGNYHQFLDDNPMNNFYPNEKVAWMDGSNVYRFGVILARLEGDSYVRSYSVQVSEEEAKVLSSVNIFKFTRLPSDRSVPEDSNFHLQLALKEDVEEQQQTNPQTNPQTIPQTNPQPTPPLSREDTIKEVKEYLKQVAKMSESDRKTALKRLYMQWHPDKNPNNIELATELFKIIRGAAEKMEKGENLEEEFNTWEHEFQARQRKANFYNRNRRRASAPSEPPKVPNMPQAKRWMKQAKSGTPHVGVS